MLSANCAVPRGIAGHVSGLFVSIIATVSPPSPHNHQHHHHRRDRHDVHINGGAVAGVYMLPYCLPESIFNVISGAAQTHTHMHAPTYRNLSLAYILTHIGAYMTGRARVLCDGFSEIFRTREGYRHRRRRPGLIQRWGREPKMHSNFWLHILKFGLEIKRDF